MKRCILAWFLIGFCLMGQLAQAAESVQLTLDYVAKKAEERAMKPFRSPRADLPAVLRDLNYDSYREIQFRSDRALWGADKLPFRVEFFHPGYIYQEPVHVNEFSPTHVQTIRFVQDFFNYRNSKLENQVPARTGYAGFKVLYPVNTPGKMDELGSFLGASYFRLLGAGQRYGLSARGLALDSGETDRPEEFPIFTDWWLGKPEADSKELVLYAILDSVSCAGAYKFRIVPGETTVADIEAVLYLRRPELIKAVNPQRKPLKTLGMAPLTSMFWFGKNSERKFDDYRPEVHDSDGLLIKTSNGETLWRPLNNASTMRHQVFALPGIKGFGLLQRERDYYKYQDLFNFYQQVPSVWIQPHSDWGEGEMHLLELSTHYEGLDNIVAFWNPKKQPKPMEAFRFGYRMKWTRETDQKLSENIVLNTRIGADGPNPKWRQIAIDFGGPKLKGIPANDPPQAIASCSSNGTIKDNQVFHNPFDNTWRVVLKMEPKEGNKEPVDIRCTLKHRDQVVSETWTYHWSPP
ncbi:MAG: glucan biosynthesis protein [Verrucomicrobia bacterium]|nr:glucan biosynthesis protein [Verrucomicrobiota bacterium]